MTRRVELRMIRRMGCGNMNYRCGSNLHFREGIIKKALSRRRYHEAIGVLLLLLHVNLIRQ